MKLLIAIVTLFARMAIAAPAAQGDCGKAIDNCLGNFNIHCWDDDWKRYTDCAHWDCGWDNADVTNRGKQKCGQ